MNSILVTGYTLKLFLHFSFSRSSFLAHLCYYHTHHALHELTIFLYCASTGITTTGGAKAYTLSDVTDATSNFKRELGKGGFGPVYYGRLPAGQEVAVKVADGSSKHEGKEFYNEVCSTHHHVIISYNLTHTCSTSLGFGNFIPLTIWH